MKYFRKFALCLLLLFLVSCQNSTNVPSPTPEIPPTITSTPENTLTSTIENTSTPFPPTDTPQPTNTSLPPTPTQVYIKPEYLEGLKKYKFDKQFPVVPVTDTGTNKEVKQVFCAFDYLGQTKVNFEYANLTIMRVAKCFFVDADGDNQFVTIPLVMHNKQLSKYYVYAVVGFIQEKNGGPSEAYFDGLSNEIMKKFVFKKYTLLHFQFNNYGRMTIQKDWVAFFKEAVDQFGNPDDAFFSRGDVSAFPDFPGAENFVFPSSMWNDRGE
jgi:hypothetical protein